MHVIKDIEIKRKALRSLSKEFADKLISDKLTHDGLLMYYIETMHELVREIKHEETFSQEEIDFK